MSDYAVLSLPRAQSSQKVDVTTSSAQSTAFADGGDLVVTVTALAFVIAGANPTAVANTSMALAANVPYRLKGIAPGEKLAFIAPTGTATAYITQGV